MTVRRFGRVLKLKPDAYKEYKRLHKNVWDDVLDGLREANIRNFNIYYWNDYLFAYMEYTGNNYEADMKTLSELPRNKEWQVINRALQEPVDAESDHWWFPMEELFHMD